MLLRCAFALLSLVSFGWPCEVAAPANGQTPESARILDYESPEIARAVARAAKENRRVLVVWSTGEKAADDLKLVDRAMNAAQVRKKLQYEYDVVKLDSFEYESKSFRESKGILSRTSITSWESSSTLMVLDSERRILANRGMETWWTLDEKQVRKLDETKLLEFLTQHQAPHLDAAKVRDAALARAKTEDKLVFLHFGAPWCGWCHKLEGWMEREHVAPLLAKQFVDLKIDTDRMLGGGDMLKALRKTAGLKEEGGIPWFVFLDADGKVLATSEGPKGNVGFPYQDEEIAHFVSMLETACKKLDADDIAKIREELAAVRREDEAKKKAK
jgi:thiol-disulfide isomerase/thioredoxin